MQSYLCKCSDNFSGRLCEINDQPTTASTKLVRNICLAEKCQNNGKCVMLFSESGSEFIFECKCEEGFHGQLCEYGNSQQPYQASRLLHKGIKRTCLNGGILINSFNKTCLCTKDFTGQFCESYKCADQYRLISNHTMCMADSEMLISGSVSLGERDFILATHNTLRTKVEPQASNMQKMYWDEKLQELAQKRAQLCDVKKIDVTMRQVPGYGIVIGENIAAGYQSWPEVLALWMSESNIRNMDAVHYTQVSIENLCCVYKFIKF